MAPESPEKSLNFTCS